ncbi:bifunctional helix-turn-helix transcriptional regulator/GNAT family N-acetyltransferase [Sphingobium sp. AR-3-1]|uniref:Bifunctional helix-turn-helix transcriptional regulator/GNAT family N-acetyltransferase n=1 Tax=Sphingobium psychrophilum TaxID=2728834 RepID=A0A7X9WUB6_9SPHN|nr:bifunctional helix-turn-helix transcriptional regulator/GNAT family N-acetyltransferase [Sphingobium psychrophilum]NML10050.1 bifunctional helix-turn-helix transcriptional regulator/GNAT family N-acetyltransferase [Sphingobium psychrophilum]
MTDDRPPADISPARAAPETVAALRAFNRFHTRFAGVLQPSYMDSGMGVTAARLLYEIAQAEAGVLASSLREQMGLDAGHASRIIAGFEKRGWIARGRGSDARQRPIALTAQGRAAFAAIDARTRADTAARIAGLDRAQQDDLVAALGQVRALLGDPMMGEGTADDWSIRPFRIGDLALVASRQARLYEAEYGWGRTMEVMQGEITTAFLRDFKPGREQAWIAERDGAMLGAVLLVDAGDDVGQLRLLHVERAARGMGIGRALVDQCIGFARDAGYRRVMLWTQDVLTHARRLYESAGFMPADREAHNLFGAEMMGERWILLLH